ncbi:MAG TPA: glutamate synthase large subunit [Anaerolineales bacterium]|jgi:glutamate synthase (ferredoxin)|nr:glutamate synthase large subunit [Anaerolineales bacterium]
MSSEYLPARELPLASAIERGACGIGFVADRHGNVTTELLRLGLTGLVNLQHRGGLDADNKTGDGAGVLTPIPTPFFERELTQLTGKTIPAERLAVGVFFLRPASAELAEQAISAALARQGISSEAWRKPPINPDVLGAQARARIPLIRQLIVARPQGVSAEQFERRLFLARKEIERRFVQHEWPDYVVSLSSRTVVYKGLLHAPQVSAFYPDLGAADFAVSSVVFHQRYSTNTLPSWERAQPLRVLCHNGEINTIQGNIAWAQARAALMQAEPDFNPESLAPVIDLRGSDSGMLDNYAELLHHAGRDLRHVLAMLLPMAWERQAELQSTVRDFYAYHSHLQEPWDGPAAVIFSDGALIGASLDRNGLRPLRFAESRSGIVYACSEFGAIPLPVEELTRIGKLGPGQMLAVDTRNGELQLDSQIKSTLAAAQPYGKWLPTATARSRRSRPRPATDEAAPALKHWLLAFGYTRDDVVYALRPMGENAKEPTGSMGDDTPPAVLSEKPRPLFNFFRQRFAEVTNPPIDPLRERVVMSLRMRLGAHGNILEDGAQNTRPLELRSPVLLPAELRALQRQRQVPARTLSTLWDLSAGAEGLPAALQELQRAALEATNAGCRLLVLSDRGVDAQRTLLPALLAVSAVHHHLLRAGMRAHVSLIVDSGEPRNVHHLATLIGYGANAVCPYLALHVVPTLMREGFDAERARQNLLAALEKGLLRIMSKMGISTVDAYCGAQIFESVGLDDELIQRYFPGTAAHLGGATLEDITRIPLMWHVLAYGEQSALPSPGYYKFKRGGELHAFAPETVKTLHRAVRTPGALNGNFAGGYAHFRHFVDSVRLRPPINVRDLMEAKPLTRAPLPLEQIQPREEIVRTFSVAAMSHGSLSSEVHETLAVAMNRLGASSNSGEGGEHPARYGDERNSRAKQIASGRFGVTPLYLMAADELQIKMAQGAKPGEGGHLPGHKVTAEIATIRHAQRGVALISPPPHHDIYSIEDLAQLIFDLRQVNPRATISVKLVAQAGVGTIASGVAKAGADVVVISGSSGGTGAAAWSSIKHVGIPWEIGLAETQRMLINAGLRGRVRLRADGGLYTGRDALMAALLGADEFSFGTSALIAAGCVMARTCHTNNCPVGVATQRQDLRAKFAGTPEQVMAYMHFVAEDLRERLAALGLTSLQDAVGRTRMLQQKLKGAEGEPELDLSELLKLPAGGVGKSRSYSGAPNPAGGQLDEHNSALLAAAEIALQGENGTPLRLQYNTSNRTRTFGARLSGEIVSRHGAAGLADGAVSVVCHGSAGQSFGAYGAPGLQLTLRGAANDYVGKSLGGARIIICPPDGYRGAHPTLAGNTVLYGATAGELFIAGRAGERFAVRNSGALAMVEGVGDHGCEYMTGGTVIVLGVVGQNFGAGMTGGVAFVHDPQKNLAQRLNGELVQASPLGSAQAKQLREWIARHAELTGSALAARLLRDWNATRRAFARVAPRASASRSDPTPATDRTRARTASRTRKRV